MGLYAQQQIDRRIAAQKASLTASPVDNTVKSVRFERLSAAELDQLVKDSVQQLHLLSQKGRAELRKRLLPGLTEIKKRIKAGEEIGGHKTVESYLQSVGLTSSMVRGWEFRLQEKDFDKLMADDWRVIQREEFLKDHPEFSDESTARIDQRLEKIAEEDAIKDEQLYRASAAKVAKEAEEAKRLQEQREKEMEQQLRRGINEFTNTKALMLEVVDMGFKHLSKRTHPDAGGSTEAQQELNYAVGRLRSLIDAQDNPTNMYGFWNFPEELRVRY